MCKETSFFCESFLSYSLFGEKGKVARDPPPLSLFPNTPFLPKNLSSLESVEVPLFTRREKLGFFSWCRPPLPFYRQRRELLVFIPESGRPLPEILSPTRPAISGELVNYSFWGISGV